MNCWTEQPKPRAVSLKDRGRYKRAPTRKMTGFFACCAVWVRLSMDLLRMGQRGLVLVGVLGLLLGGRPVQAGGLWRRVAKRELQGRAPRLALVPRSYQAAVLDSIAFGAALEGLEVGKGEAVVELPGLDGSVERYRIRRYAVMEPGLAAQFPSVRTYLGVREDDPSIRVHLAWSGRGLNALVMNEHHVVSIQPMSPGEQRYYAVFARDRLQQPRWTGGDLLGDFLEQALRSRGEATRGVERTGSEVRVLRLAVTASRHYTNQVSYSGDPLLVRKADTLAAIVSKINEIHAITLPELSLRFILVEKNSELIFTDATDPGFTEPCELGRAAAENFELNQETVDGIVGPENYDVGHLFVWSTCGGVTGGLSCSAGKAKALTGSAIPVEILVHELGHQLGMPHVWSRCNGETGSQYSPEFAFEPGSGSTLMSYAGLCGPDNVAASRLFQFHSKGIDRVYEQLDNGESGLCGTVVDMSSLNHPPAVSAGTSGLVFPKGTPFLLRGTGSDQDGDSVRFSWEEIDLPDAPDTPTVLDPNDPGRTVSNPEQGSAPNDNEPPYFSVFQASSSPERTFPKLEEILSGDPDRSLGEFVPVPSPGTTRTVQMRLVARDSFPEGGGLAYDLMDLTFDGDSGPFRVVAPSSSEPALSWRPGSTTSVAWDVAGTDEPPVGCVSVDIDLSVDGGWSYLYSLAASVPNDGSQEVEVPSVATDRARVRVSCASTSNHFFFDVSDSDFPIEPDNSGCQTSTAAPYVVKSLSDYDPNDPNNPDDSFEARIPCTLRATVRSLLLHHDYGQEANPVITFDPSLAGGRLTLKTEIVLPKPIVIDGEDLGITISGAGVTRQFTVVARPVTLRSLTLVEGNGFSESGVNSGQGGAVSMDCRDGLVTLDKMAFLENSIADGRGADRGGAVYFLCGDGLVMESLFRGNEADFGGGALFAGGGGLRVARSLFEKNRVSTYSNAAGGAVALERATVEIENSTLTGNFSAGSGGAIGGWFSDSTWSSPLTITNSTLVENEISDVGSTQNGRNIEFQGALILRNSIVAGGTPNDASDCWRDRWNDGADGGDLLESRNNLIGDGGADCAASAVTVELMTGEPKLGGLRNNGGITKTMELLESSPAIDAGAPEICGSPTVGGLDQRGYGRPATTCDIGAYEFRGILPPGAPHMEAAIFSVDEGAALGTLVGSPLTVGGTPPLAYAITDGNVHGTFSIDSASGEIRVARNRYLYVSQMPHIILAVAVIDSSSPPLADRELITVELRDVNLAPEAKDAALTIFGTDPAGTLVGRVEAVDSDPGDALSFAITGGNDRGAFAIDRQLGEIRVTEKAVFPTSYTLNVTVTDDGAGMLSDMATVEIDAVECAPGLVTNLLDSAVPAGPSSLVPCSLRERVATAAPGEVITFQPSLAGGILKLNGEIDIDKSLIIDGQKLAISIDAGSKRAFHIQGAGTLLATLRGLEIRHGAADDLAHWAGMGGAIFNCGELLTLERMIFAENSGTAWGAALAQSCGGSVIVEDSEFDSNQATGCGAAYYQATGEAFISRSTFVGNRAVCGGAIRIQGGKATLSNTTFAGNSAQLGGAIRNGGNLEINNSTFSGNRLTPEQSNRDLGASLYNSGGGKLWLRNVVMANGDGQECFNSQDSGNPGLLLENVGTLVEDGSCNTGTKLRGFMSGDPNLGPLKNQGGSTRTMGLQEPSAAIASGDAAVCSGAGVGGMDQRGSTRPASYCDRGAYETSTDADPGSGGAPPPKVPIGSSWLPVLALLAAAWRRPWRFQD